MESISKDIASQQNNIIGLAYSIDSHTFQRLSNLSEVNCALHFHSQTPRWIPLHFVHDHLLPSVVDHLPSNISEMGTPEMLFLPVASEFNCISVVFYGYRLLSFIRGIFGEFSYSPSIARPGACALRRASHVGGRGEETSFSHIELIDTASYLLDATVTCN